MGNQNVCPRVFVMFSIFIWSQRSVTACLLFGAGQMCSGPINLEILFSCPDQSDHTEKCVLQNQNNRLKVAKMLCCRDENSALWSILFFSGYTNF